MKYSSLILSFLAVAFLTSCSDSSNGTSVQEESKITSALDGIFAQNKDSLHIISKEDSFGKNIDFNLSATRDEAVKVVFNEAPLVDQSSKMEHYRLKSWISGDTSYIAYELIDFTFNFENDSWTVTDTIIITDHNANLPAFTNLGGNYKRVK